MSVRELPDAGGSTLTIKEVDGHFYPTFELEAIKGLTTFKARSDDVVVCAYPKSGTHWVWEMIRFLLAGSTDLSSTEKDEAMLEYIIPQKLEAIPSPRPLNTHGHFECLSPEFFSQKLKIIYITRDPRDIAVSFFNHHKKLVNYYHYTGEWKNYLPNFMDGNVDYDSWFQYTKGWERGMKEHSGHPFYITSYETLHRSAEDEVRKIAKFIGVNHDEEFLDKVVKRCSFDVMRKSKGSMDYYGRSQSPIMYRKGKVGDWKNWFTVAQSESFNDRFEQEMQGTDAYQLYSHTVQVQSDDNMNSQ